MRLTDANQAAVAVQTRRRTPSAQSHQKTLSGGVATCPHGATGCDALSHQPLKID
uniref:Uncharacterized protein n=1 Tax=Oryza sativa subsp. japonica TaxID=39947 RepID=Q67UK3_ORYSJ|nr:hypothetical protein [Oryza sativa Japonica Group]